ncbi:hypothetical protein D3C79_1080230 [compost metagenome]
MLRLGSEAVIFEDVLLDDRVLVAEGLGRGVRADITERRERRDGVIRQRALEIIGAREFAIKSDVVRMRVRPVGQ